MKNIFKTFVILAAATVGFAGRSNALPVPDYSPLLPMAPQLCAMCTPSAMLTAASAIDKVEEWKQTYEKIKDTRGLIQKAKSYSLNLTEGYINKVFSDKDKKTNGNRVLSFSRTIEGLQGKTEADVQREFKIYFLQYPSSKNTVQEAYRQKGDQFKIDSALEVYVTATEMLKELYGDNTEGNRTSGILDSLEAMETCIIGGDNEKCAALGMEQFNCQAKEGEDEDKICYWNNALKVARVYDQIMRNNEYLNALKEQYHAAMSVDNLAKIRSYDRKEVKKLKKEEKAANKAIKKADKAAAKAAKKAAKAEKKAAKKANKNKTSLILKGHTSQKLYAELTASLAFADELEDAVDGMDEDLASDDLFSEGFAPVDTADGYSTAIDGKEDDFNSLALLENAADALNAAVKVHNIKNSLPNYRQIFRSYHEVKDYHEATAKNVMSSGMCIENFLTPYYANPKKAWFGDNCGYMLSGYMYCHYQNEKAADDSSKSIADFDILCPEDVNHKCYAKKMSMENGSGISGYLLALYNEAKAQDALNDVETYVDVKADADGNLEFSADGVNSEDDRFITGRLPEGNENVWTPYSETNKKAAGDAGASTHTILNQALGDEMEAESRKNELLSWTLGSIVSKEIEKDLSGNQEKFGKSLHKFPLWNDQKEFYNQYLDAKYDNMADYIANEPFGDFLCDLSDEINNIFPYQQISALMLTESPESYRQKVKKAIADLRSFVSENTPEDEDFITKTDKELEDLRAEHDNKMNALKQRKDELYAIMDRLSQELDTLNKQLNALNNIINEADTVITYAQSGQEYDATLYENRTLSAESPMEEEYALQQSDGERAKEEAVKAKQMTADVAALEKEIKETQKAIDAVNDSMEKERASYVKKYADIESKTRLYAKSKLENRDTALISEKIKEEAEEFLPIATAYDLMSCVRQHAINEIMETKEKIEVLKSEENIYYAESSQELTDLHNQLIDKITHISISDIAECELSNNIMQNAAETGLSAVLDLVPQMLTDVCNGEECKTPDTEYFVGLTGKKRDFRAPKEAVAYSSAPWREIFHFDIIDYESVDKYVYDKPETADNQDIIITADSFLRSGMEIPLIWQYILRPHTFVERDIDLLKFFGSDMYGEYGKPHGNANKAVLRSGTFPCYLDGHIIDVTDSILGFGYSVDKVDADDLGNYPVISECLGLEMDNGKIVDKAAGSSVAPTNLSNSANGVKSSGELAQILDYVPYKEDVAALQAANAAAGNGLPMNWNLIRFHLTFNGNLQKTVSVFYKSQTAKEDKNQDLQYYMSSRIFAGRNQFGDFLNHVELEAVAADALMKVENRVNDTRKEFKQMLNEVNIDIKEDFDLTDAEDYEAIAAALDEQKQIGIADAVEYISHVNGQTETIYNKVENLSRKIEILRLDEDEDVAISGEEDPDELAEQIKNSQADRAVVEEYNKAGSEAVYDQISRLPAPYCATYPNK